MFVPFLLDRFNHSSAVVLVRLFMLKSSQLSIQVLPEGLGVRIHHLSVIVSAD